MGDIGTYRDEAGGGELLRFHAHDQTHCAIEIIDGDASLSVVLRDADSAMSLAAMLESWASTKGATSDRARLVAFVREVALSQSAFAMASGWRGDAEALLVSIGDEI